MGTGAFRVATAALALGAAGGGCGSYPAAPASTGTAPAGGQTASAWLDAPPAPLTWPAARIPSGARMRYPPSWRRSRSDPGTASAVLIGPAGRYLGYLNLTPRQGAETLADWSTFRIDHNREEGERNVRRLSAATNLSFATGRGSCVRDEYTTRTNARYIEVACLIMGRRAPVVVVGAASPDEWPRVGGEILRAVVGVEA